MAVVDRNILRAGRARAAVAARTCRPRWPSTRPSSWPRSSGPQESSRFINGLLDRIAERASIGLRVGGNPSVRYAILSDVHGNLEALRGRPRRRQPARRTPCCRLGDTVGYGRRPAGLRGADRRARPRPSWPATTSTAVADRLDLGWFNRLRAPRRPVDPRAPRLPPTAEWLGALPLVRRVGDATLVHASPAQPDEWDYLVTAEDGFAAFSHFTTRLVLRGPLARPGRLVARLVRARPRARRGLRAKRAGRRYIVNVGQCGVSPATGIRAGDLGAVGRGGRADRPAPRRLRRRCRSPEDHRGRAPAIPGRCLAAGA